ncbi:hypothetical protein BDZ94DRAFT_750302 [Collybia nuda]|uniref:TM7S3/TM198-like domain-containing protein n=1 Tax=Collybia nuda TaxID=64659 RepID=A0A9P6CHC0_9AGAR|nr:hypothetical protein BDZ94DRAFT_750302 [Collybia nuda]
MLIAGADSKDGDIRPPLPTTTTTTTTTMWLRYFLSLAFLVVVAAQSSNSSTPTPTPTPTPSLSLSLTTANVTRTLTTRSGNQNIPLTTVVPIVFNVTHTITPTTSAAPSNSTASATSTPSTTLDTKLDPAFGVLGAILILTGLPSAFWGHKNRWTSFFLIGFYTLSLVCVVLILKFGVLAAVNPPSKTLRGMFVLASVIAGVAGGAIAIFFWKAARYGIGAWGGFALGLWIQCFHNGGLIKAIGFRWILYIGCAVIGFTLCTIPKIHYHILLISTAFVGASAFMLGVDCFTTAGLKEFYIWNLGFRSLFPKFAANNIEFPVSQTMQIELGLIGAVALMGAAVQLRILSVLHTKLQEISAEQKKRDEEAEHQAANRFDDLSKEREEWEKDHPTLSKHARQQSGLSTMPLMKDQDGSASPTTPEHLSTFTLVNDGRARQLSGVSDFKVAPTPDEELRRAARNSQNPGVLPTLDLGLGIQEDVPRGFIAEDELRKKEMTPIELEELKRKEELMLEIQTIRRSIDALRSETPAPSSSTGSRRPSMTSRRTLSIDANSALLPIPSHLRPPRAADPRARVHSLEMSTLASYSALQGEPLSRPTSVPVRDEDWDSYVHDRKLLQPPAGVTPPIVTSPIATPAARMPMPQAVAEALNQRKRRESALEHGAPSTDSSDDIPLARIAGPKRSSSTGGYIPVTVLPPRKGTSPITSPIPQRPSATRTRTFEELNERHREKMRDMQAPVTQAAKEQEELNAAKQRWERNKILEKEAVAKRQAERVAQLEKRKEAVDRSGRKTDAAPKRHSRSLSGDRLGAMGGSSSKRLSMLKVEDWQRYQQDVEMGVRGDMAPRHDSKPHGKVPFPDSGRGRDRTRNKSQDPLS